MIAECENCGFRKPTTVKEIEESDDDYNPCPECGKNAGWDLIPDDPVFESLMDVLTDEELFL